MVSCVIASVKELLARDDEGQGLVEYGLILVLISVVAITAMSSVGSAVIALFTEIADALTF